MPIKNTSWLNFDYEPRVQKRQQVNEHQSYISIFVTYLTFSSSSYENQPRHDNIIPSKVVDIHNSLRRRKLHRTSQGSNFLGDILAIDKIQEPQFNLKEKENPSTFKDDFSIKTDPPFSYQ